MSEQDRYNKPLDLGKLLQDVLGKLDESSDSERIAARVVKVHEMYRKVIEQAYRQSAQHMLDHTNSVYIMDKNGARTLTVYVDEAIYAADLNAQRELIKLLFLQRFNEKLEVFDIFVSRRNYKLNHPFAENEDVPEATPRALTAEEISFVRETCARIEDVQLRSKVEKAMIASLKYQSTENGEK